MFHSAAYRSKGPASAKHHFINIWELILIQHWHWMVSSTQDTKISFQITIAVKTTPKSECESRKNYLHEYCHSSVYILWNCKSKSIENILWKTWLNSWTSCWYHHQNQYSEVNTNKELCETSCLPNSRTSTTRQLPAHMTNYFELLSHLKSTRFKDKSQRESKTTNSR